MDRVMVCGGAGFIGSHLVDRLLADGASVVVLDDLSTGHEWNLAAAARSRRFDFTKVDVTDLEAVTDVISRRQPQVVYHLAARVDLQHSRVDPHGDARTNILGTIAVCDAARRAGVRKVVLASSVAIYGAPAVLPVTEDTPAAPTSPYAVSKLASELYLRHYRGEGLDSTTLVLANAYGRRQRGGVVAAFLACLRAGVPGRLYGGGTNTRDYVHVDDVVDALVLAAGDRASGLRLNIGTGVATSDRDLLHMVQAAVGRDPVEALELPARGDVPDMRVDAALARSVLGWEPKVRLVDGLARTVNG